MKQELTFLLKQRSILLLLFISLLLTLMSLWNGWENIRHIRSQISHAQHEETLYKQQQLLAHSHQGKIEAGDVGYYVFHHVYHHPTDWSFIALGNRQVTPYVQRIRLLGLQSQLYDGESHHPEYVMLGAFDYSFWLVFFSPLLCIALMHDLKASEFQAQRLLFLNSVVMHPIRFWATRIFLRWALIVFTLLIPIVTFALFKSLPLSEMLKVISITVCYSLFWTVICAAISLRNQSINATFNAILLTSLWLLLCVIIPNLSQLWIHQRYPVQEGSQLAIQHRQLVHGAWDLPKEATLQPFYTLYPQWQNSPPITGRFHWKWYYAFQHMADVKLATQVKQREEALLERDTASAWLSVILPSVWAQHALENIAQSNISHLLNHRHAITNYHTQLRHYFYPYLFEDKQMTEQDFLNIPAFQANHSQKN